MSETFRATIRRAGRTAAGIEVPADVIERLGGGRRPSVRVTLDGYTYRWTVGVMGGRYLVGVTAEHRARSGLEAGQEVQVTLELDDSPRELAVPPELAAALDADPGAKAFFDGLSYSNRRVFTLSVEGTSNPATKARRVAAAMERMREGRVR